MKKWFFTGLLALIVCGCGAEWFPENNPSITPPNSFTFTNPCGVPVKTLITSDAITVSGLSSQVPISISNNNGSMYSINDGGFTNSPGLVSNGQTVKVQHISADTAGGTATNTIVITTLTIGGVSGTFKSDTNPCLRGTNFP